MLGYVKKSLTQSTELIYPQKLFGSAGSSSESNHYFCHVSNFNKGKFMRGIGILLGCLIMFSVHAQSPTSAATQLKTVETKEALAFATDYVKSHLSRCNGAIFIKLLGGDYKDSGYRGSPFGGLANLYQLLVPNVAVQPLKEITDIDKMNGLEWSGRIVVVAKAARPFHIIYGNNDAKAWGKWYDATKPRTELVVFETVVDEASKSPVLVTALEKRQGKWVIGSLRLDEPPACDEIPALPN